MRQWGTGKTPAPSVGPIPTSRSIDLHGHDLGVAHRRCPCDNGPVTETDPNPRDLLASRDIPCPDCDYNLRGLTQPCCPECGRAITTQIVQRQLQLARARAQERKVRARWFATLCALLMGALLANAAIVAVGYVRFEPRHRLLIILAMLALATTAGTHRAWVARAGRADPQRADRIIEHTQGIVGALTLTAVIPLIVGGLVLVVQLLN